MGDIIANWLLDMAGKVVRTSKNPKTVIIIDILVAFFGLLAAGGYAIWNAVCYYRQGNVLAAVLIVAGLVIALLLVGFLMICRTIRRREANKEL